MRGEVYTPLTPESPLEALQACRLGRAAPASVALRGGGLGGRVSWELLLPPAALRGCFAAASGAGTAARSSETEPSQQVHCCGDGSGMTGHHGWGYGQNDGRRRPRPPAIR